MDFFAPLFSFVTDNTKKMSARAITVLVSVTILLIVDNTMGFSYYYSLEKKLTIITQLNTAIKDTSLSKDDKHLLLTLRLNLIKHKSLKEDFWDFIENPNINWNSNNYVENNNTNFSYCINIVTAASVPIALMITSLVAGLKAFFSKKSIFNDDRVSIFIKLVGLGTLFYTLGILEAKLLLQIPIIFNHVYYNFILNILINISLVLLTYFIFDIIPKFLKKRKAANSN